MTIFGQDAVLQVCNIAAPRTGLEVKFSIRHLAALALNGADTANPGLFEGTGSMTPQTQAAREKIAFQPRDLATRSAATVTLETRDGRTLHAEADVGVPAADTDAQWSKLTAKARSIATPVIGAERVGAMIAAVAKLDGASEIAPLMRLLA